MTGGSIKDGPGPDPANSADFPAVFVEFSLLERRRWRGRGATIGRGMDVENGWSAGVVSHGGGPRRHPERTEQSAVPAELVGREVSTRAFMPLWQAVRARGIDPQRIAAGTGFT